MSRLPSVYGKWFALILFSVALFGGLVLWRKAPEFLEQFLTGKLAELNASEVVIQGISAELGALKIGDLSLRFKRVDYDLTLSFTNLHLTGFLEDLRNRRFNAISADSARMRVLLPEEAESPRAVARFNFDPLELPFTQILLPRVSISVERPGSFSASGEVRLVGLVDRSRKVATGTIAGSSLSLDLAGWASKDIDAEIGFGIAPLPADLQMNIKLDANSGVVPFGEFKSLKAKGRISVGAEIREVSPVEIQLEQLTAGVEFKKLRGDFTTTRPAQKLMLKLGAAEVLGGKILIPVATFDPSSGKVDAEVKVSEITIEEILKLYPQKQISGSGTLIGEVKVRREHAGVPVVSGTLSAKPPGGHLSYKGDATLGAQESPELNLAFRALEKFQYSVLEASIGSEASGDMNLGIHLKGNSPNVNTDREIVVNLNIQENLPALFRSLQIGKEVGEKLSGGNK